MKKLKFYCGDYAAFFTFIVYASSSVVLPVILPDLAAELGFPLDDGGKGVAGALHAVRSMTMLFAMLAGGFLAAKYGVRRNMIFSIAIMSLAVGCCVFVPDYGSLMLLIAVAGLGEGLIEALGTPVVQKLHCDDEPGRYINFTHAFWSVGVVLATIGAGVMLLCGVSWRLPLLLILLMGIPPFILFLVPSERRERLDLPDSGGGSFSAVMKNAAEIIKNRRFWLYFLAMFFAGGGEWCLTFWTASYVRLVLNGSALAGGIAAAVFAFGMIGGRMGAGIFVREKHLPHLLIISAAATILLGIAVPFIRSLYLLILFVFLLGLTIGPFWPTIQSVCVDKLKLDATLLYILLSCSGIPGAGVFTWCQGIVGDMPQIGFSGSFFMVPLSVLIMLLLLCAAFRGTWSERKFSAAAVSVPAAPDEDRS